MEWVKPEFSKRRVDIAGRALADGNLSSSEENEALEMLNNWRASHSFPLNTFQVGLRQRSRQVTRQPLIAQRLKRTPSILLKQRRFPTMQLTRMQDIGGCRSVVQTVKQVRELRKNYLNSDLKHILAGEKDYIEEPKASGYRSIHLVYRYRSDKKDTYNGLLIEVQLRSRLQHAWATAVETVGTFLARSLKSSEGPEEWLQFLALTSSAFALVENTPLVPDTPTSTGDLKTQIIKMAEELDVQNKLKSYGFALQVLERHDMRKAHYFLLSLNPSEAKITIYGYHKGQLSPATSKYLEVEKEMRKIPGAEAVLVAIDSLGSLRRAYPNYFLDTQVFLSELNKIIE